MGLFDDVLLTADFDRTFSDRAHKVPERNLEAVRYFTENGGSFTINTGRSVTTFRKHLEQIPVNAPYLLYNGSAAYDKGELSLCRPIELEIWPTLRKMRELFPEMNLEVQGAETHYLVDETPEYVAFYEAWGWTHSPALPETDMGPFLKFSLFGTSADNSVSDLYQATQEQRARFDYAHNKILELYGDKVEVFRPAVRIIDVHAKGVSKLRSARDLQAKLGKKILVCVGDGENDISMLDGADYAFCPADAVVADRYENVCVCDEGAVAEVIYQKIPEILEKQP